MTGQVYGWFGDVTDTRWHTLEFQAVIQTGQGGQTIQNTALVNADNIDQPGEPTEIMLVWQVLFDWNGSLNAWMHAAGLEQIDWMKSAWCPLPPNRPSHSSLAGCFAALQGIR